MLIQMLAPAYQLSAHDQLAPAYQLSALDHSQVIADQTFELSIFFSLAGVFPTAETLYHIEQPLQRLSSAASERPQNESQSILRDDNFHIGGLHLGRAGGPGCDGRVTGTVSSNTTSQNLRVPGPAIQVLSASETPTLKLSLSEAHSLPVNLTGCVTSICHYATGISALHPGCHSGWQPGPGVGTVTSSLAVILRPRPGFNAKSVSRNLHRLRAAARVPLRPGDSDS